MTTESPPPDSSDASTGSDDHDASHHPFVYRIPADPHVMCPNDHGALNPPPEALRQRLGDGSDDLRALRDRALTEASRQAAAECARTFELPSR